MARVKINEFPVATTIADNDLGVKGDATTGVSSKITWLNIVAYLRTRLGYKAEVNAATTPFTSATLEAAYPDAIIGDEVICNDLTNEGPTLYKKVTDTIWRSIPMAPLE